MTADFEAYMPESYDGKPFGPEELLKLEDEAGIDLVVTMPSISLRPDNKRLAKLIEGYDRMIGCVCVNPCFGDEAVQELKIAVKEWGFKGLKLMATAHKYYIDSEIVHPLMKAAEELGIPVTIHSGSDGCYPSQITTLAQVFPDVLIIMDHMGYRSWVEDAIDAAKRCPNIHLGTTLIAAAEPIRVKEAVEEVGADRVVFGSNAPSGVPLLGVEGIKRLSLGDEAEKLVLGGNLVRIYRLKS